MRTTVSYSYVVWLTAVLIGGVSWQACSVCPAQTPAAAPKEALIDRDIATKTKQMADLARRTYDAYTELFAGRSATFADLHKWSLNWMRAEAAVNRGKPEETLAIESHLKRHAEMARGGRGDGKRGQECRAGNRVLRF